MFNVGDKVFVLPHSDYRGKYVGESGIVERTFKSREGIIFGVKLDNFTHVSSKYGVFWFKLNSISLNESEDNFMFNNYVVAEVSFLDNQKMCYSYALYDSTIQVGDDVVVHTGHHGFALAKITSICEDEGKKKEVMAGREVVCKIDFTPYNDRQDAVKRAIELKKNMDKKIREAQTTAIYEMFAEKDPALKEMLEEYKGIMQTNM